MSILHNDFQIDFIVVKPEFFEYSKHYFSYNDLGNLTGKLCKKLGFKHGQNGLEYVIRDHTINSDNRVEDTILLSNDPFKHLEILGLSTDKFREGFNTFEEMFEYVSTSPYFNSKFYLFEELTNKDRVRDRKRATYKAFLDWCQTKETTAFEPPEDRSVYPLQWFPELQIEIDRVYAEVELRNKLKEKFNGNLIMELIPTLSGRELGKFMFAVKEYFTDEFILKSEQNIINNKILTFYEIYTNDTV